MQRITGLLLIEVRNSNPNGDPDRESDPRQRADGRGEISPVSFKRKIRDLVELKDGPAWVDISRRLKPEMNPDEFVILESKGRDRDAIKKEVSDGIFTRKYWDARLFGATFLEKELASHIRTGVCQFGLGLSLCPVEITRHTLTNKAGVEGDKERGMAPLAYRTVEHGLYTMPFFVNPSTAHRSSCTQQDVDLLLALLPYAYSNNQSLSRTQVNLVHIYAITHSSPLGSVSDFRLLDVLTPVRKGPDPMLSSQSLSDYDIPVLGDAMKPFEGKVTAVDLAI